MRSRTDLPDPSNSRVNDEDPKVDLPFESVDEMLWCGHSNETSPALLSQCPVCFSAFYKEKFGIFVEF